MTLPPLPIDRLLPEVVEAVRAGRNVVIVAPPGAGKTTRVPPALIAAGTLAPDHPALIVLQPRRVAARVTAQRIADEHGWRLGEEVGYVIRFDRRVGPRTRIRVATEGVLNRLLLADPFLEGIGAVVLDEFHERSLHTDLALALLKEVQQTVRPDLKLIVMSATLDAEPVARFLGDCPVVRSEGRMFPVEVTYCPAAHPTAPDVIGAAVDDCLRAGSDSGDILVFLPGVEEIRRAAAALAPVAVQRGVVVLPLHGSLSADEQDLALRPSARRKIILATNIAETSLTIDGVRTVIDSGRARFASFDPARGLDRLELGRISRASAAQRAGRAGRTAPGRCIRLWSEREQRGLPEAEVPELLRVDLSATVLALRAWGAHDISSFGWYEAPPGDRVAAAERLLEMLGAFTGEPKRLTPLGRQLLEIAAHPRLARLLIASTVQGFAREGAALAALLSEKDIVRAGEPGQGVRPVSGRGSSDLIARLDRLAEAENDRFSARLRSRGIDGPAARRTARVRDDLLRQARRVARDATGRPPDDHPSADGREPTEDELLQAILLAYPDRVVKRRGSEATGVMVGGRGVRLSPASVVRESGYFVAIDPRDDRRGATREARVQIASAIRLEWLETLFPESVRRERSVRFDEGRQRVVGVSSLWYRDLLLSEDLNAPVDPLEAGRALAAALGPRVRELLAADESAAAWLARLTFINEAMPDLALPAFTDEVLAEAVADAAVGKRTVDEVTAHSLLPMLKLRLVPAQNRLLDEHAPESLMVPSGNRIRLRYEPGRPPILAVRLQELFGWTETPRIAGGRVPIVVHILGPNFRPVQVTNDLRSFWTTTYFQVRKDLRGRYPKHSWPEDPLTARAEAKGGRRNP
jgi:ATP-dependent helicase HrpB